MANNDRQPRDDQLEQDVAQLIRGALSVPARPLSERHKNELAAEVALRARPRLPGWALLACCGCILALALFGVAAPGVPEEWQRLALLVPAANLLFGPLAAWVIVTRGRSSASVGRSEA